MATGDIYVKRQPTYEIIQYTGTNADEVRAFLTERGNTAFIACAEGTLGGSSDSGTSPYWVGAGSYLIWGLLDNTLSGTATNIDDYELKA